MFGPKPGVWWVHSKSDPRFNREWRTDVLISGGIPPYINDWVEQRRLELGMALEDLPKDLEVGAMKD